MTQSLNNETPKGVDFANIIDKQKAGAEIEYLVATTEQGYLGAASQWLQENSIPEAQFNKYVPQVIIDKIKDEAINDYLLRPSMSRTEKTNTLDFML